WEILIQHYLGQKAPGLLKKVEADPEAGMYTASMELTPQNVETLKELEAHLRTMLADEETLMGYLDIHEEDIEWD
ncbi:MAG: Imm51 family immunity protein, partial [Acidobacteriota bacterium]